MPTQQIHPDDLVYQIIERQYKKGWEDAEERYLRGGHQDAQRVKRLIERLELTKDLKVLDFAAGFGRVTRHLPTILPEAIVVASDIHPAACEFMERKFGIATHVSTFEPETADIGGDYDFIFALSLFSHLPDETFGPWLRCLYDRLSPGGYLMFTCNGLDAMKTKITHMREFYDDKTGYGFRNVAFDQTDLPDGAYGGMVVAEWYVRQIINQLNPPVECVEISPFAWFGHQDEWIIKKAIDNG